MNISKAKMNNRIVDVISFDDYVKNPHRYTPYQTVVSYNGILYPIKSVNNEDIPGIYFDGLFFRFINPLPQDLEAYSANNVIDFNNLKSIKDLIEKQDELKSLERTILTTVDNEFIPQVQPTDSLELKAMKEAVAAKHIDIDKYAYKFGNRFNNDKRLFNRSSMTLDKIVLLANIFDIEVKLTLRDKSPDVPNPMGKVIETILTNDNNLVDNGDEEE